MSQGLHKHSKAVPGTIIYGQNEKCGPDDIPSPEYAGGGFAVHFIFLSL
jgi:hypothetical protein